jgi:hypothetical protein
MPADEQRVAIIREHTWAGTYAIYWLVMCLAVFLAAPMR